MLGCNRRVGLGIGLMVLCAMPLVAQAQSGIPNAAAIPQRYDYDFQTRRIIINQQAETAFTLDLPDNIYVPSPAINADGSMAAFCYSDELGAMRLVVRDLYLGSNLLELPIDGYCNVAENAFSADSTRLAFGVVNADFDFFEPDDPQNWSLNILDIFNGQIIASLEGSMFPPDDSGYPFLPMAADWSDPNLLIFYLQPFYFEGMFTGLANAYHWNFTSNQVTIATDPLWGQVPQDYLPETGERLWLERNTSYSYTDNLFPYDAGFNVVMLKDAQGSRIVFQIGDGSIERAFFTPDGLAIEIHYYRITDPNTFTGERVSMLLYRDGLQTLLNIISTDIAIPMMVWRAPLDLSNIRLAAFQTFAAREREVITCPGFMPSRLLVNQNARVTPGQPNNIRAEPRRQSSKLGEIPGNAVFYVFEGPVCDTEGRAWWRVDYNGIVGWTAEGEGNKYFTEPLTP